MLGSVPPPVRLRLRWTPIGAVAGGQPAAGSGVRLRIDATDEAGAPLDVAGLWVWTRRPGGVVVRTEGEAIARVLPGLYQLDFTLDAAGTWTWEAGCAGPRDARSAPLSLAVTASRVAAANPPGPIMVDESGEPIVLGDGTFWTVRRVTALPMAPDHAGLTLVGVRNGASCRVGWEALEEGAAAAGEAGLRAANPIVGLTYVNGTLVATRLDGTSGPIGGVSLYVADGYVTDGYIESALLPVNHSGASGAYVIAGYVEPGYAA